MVIIGVWYVYGGLLYYFLYFYVYLKVSVISEKKFEFLYKNLEQSDSYHYDFCMIYIYYKQNNMLP